MRIRASAATWGLGTRANAFRVGPPPAKQQSAESGTGVCTRKLPLPPARARPAMLREAPGGAVSSPPTHAAGKMRPAHPALASQRPRAASAAARSLRVRGSGRACGDRGAVRGLRGFYLPERGRSGRGVQSGCGARGPSPRRPSQGSAPLLRAPHRTLLAFGISTLPASRFSLPFLPPRLVSPPALALLQFVPRGPRTPPPPPQLQRKVARGSTGWIWSDFLREA